MAKDIVLGGFFTHATDLTGVTGLTVTIDVWRVTLADLTKSEVVTAGSCPEIGDGVYAYRVASADLQTYTYFGILKTSDSTVAQKHIAAVMLDFADSPGIAALVWAYGTRTLTSLSALVASVAAAVWAYATRTLTQSAASVAAAVQGARLTIHRGDSWSATITGLAANTGYSKIWFTLKEAKGDADADAIVALLLTDPSAGTDGLQRLNKAAATAGQGSITVNSATSLTVALDPAVTAVLTPRKNLVYDIQYLIGAAISTPAEGNADVDGDVTRVTS